MKKLVFILSVLSMLIVSSTDVQAQWLKKIGQQAMDRAKARAKDKVEQAVDEMVDKTVDGAFDAPGKVLNEESQDSHSDEGQLKDRKEEVAKSPQQGKTKNQSLEAAYAKSDFVAGDEIIFDDDFADERLGEFPSKWDLLEGNAEVASLGGVKAIYMAEGGTKIVPLMENPKNYLPDVFTIEMDVYVSDSETSYTEEDNRTYSRYLITFYQKDEYDYSTWDLNDFGEQVEYSFLRTTEGNKIDGRYETKSLIRLNDWNHIAFSFNKRAFKAYVNGTRVTNIPNTVHHTWFDIYRYDYEHHTRCYIRNVRIAKGAVPLYDRMMTDGKFITYGITFDIGKSTIKPESMGEINRIVKLMTDNPDLKFSVEGHTDSTGNTVANQALSEARSKAIVDKLVEQGISSNRLSSTGKGSNNPIADNGTDEGRARNRRVEFVKI